MRIFLSLSKSLILRARVEAKRRGVTVSVVIEEWLHQVVPDIQRPARRALVSLPECHAGGGTYPGVSLGDTNALLERMGARC